MNTLTLSARVAERNYRVQWRKSLLLRREGALSRSEELEAAWSEAFPKHDIETARLKPLKLLEQFDSERWHREVESLAAERARQCDPKLERLRRLLKPGASFERAYSELNDPRHRPTPGATIEALWLAIREGGIAALNESTNKQRLQACDAAARAELKKRLSRLRS
jgi:hypothetical protein